MEITAETRSDQINADDFITTGPMTFTIAEVVKGKAEQPFDFILVENGKAYRPGVIMRRVIVAAWGKESSNYAGRRLTLYRDPSVRFGTQATGGIRISHMSHITKRIEVMSQVTRGKREKFSVDPLPDLSPADRLRLEWKTATPERRKEIEAEMAAAKEANQ
jgi:hypothetical protein